MTPIPNPPDEVTIMKTAIIALLAVGLAHSVSGQPDDPCFNYASDHLRGIGALDGVASARSAAVRGSLAAVGAWDEGLVLVDLTDPAVPVEIGRIDTPGYVRSTAIANGLVYAVDAAGLGLMVVDPAAAGGPALLGSLPLGGPGYGLTIAGDRAYVANGSLGLHAVDVADPSAPGLLFTEPTFSARDCAVSGALLVLADGSAGLKLIDPAAAAGARVVGQLALNGQAHGVAVSGGVAWVAGWSGGLHAVDVADPAAPLRLATAGLPAGLALDVTMHQGMVLVAGGTGGLHVFDPTLPAAPALVGTMGLSVRDVAKVAGDGDLVCVADAALGLRVALGRGPLAVPRHYAVAAANLERFTWHGDQLYGFLYPEPYTYNLHHLDVTDPRSPVISGILTFTSFLDGAAQIDNAVGYASRDRVRAYMTSGPPTTNSSSLLGQPLGEMISHENTAIVATGTGFATLTLNPVEVLAERSTGSCHSLTVEGDNLHALTEDYLRHYDIVDPTWPQPQAILLLSPMPRWVRAAGPARVATLTQDGVLDVYTSPYGGPITRVGGLAGPFGAPIGFESRGTTACILVADGFALVDLSDPADPVLIVQQTGLAMGTLKQCALTDQYLVLASDEGLRLLSLPCDLTLSRVGEAAPAMPAGVSAQPNPFNPRTNIRFELAQRTGARLAVFDLAGRRVRTLLGGEPLRAGPHSVAWTGDDDRGRSLASGVYLLRLEAGGRIESSRVTLLR